MSNRTKEICRRIIRVLMILIGVSLLLVGLGIPIINNAIAFGVERELKAYPLPAETTLIESTSVAGKLTGNGNGMQYYGAILVKTERTPQELLLHYGGEDGSLMRYGGVLSRDSTQDDGLASRLPFVSQEDGEGYYIVYRQGSVSQPWRDWLDLDLRGH